MNKKNIEAIRNWFSSALSSPIWVGLAVIIPGLFLLYDNLKETKESPSDIAKKYEYRPDIKFTHFVPKKWSNDEEEFLTFYFLNKSKGPANNLSFILRKNNKTLYFTDSKLSDIFNNRSFTLNSNEEIGIPIGPLRELKKLFSDTGDIIGFGLDPEFSKDAKKIFQNKYNSNKNFMYDHKSTPINIVLQYKGIMEDILSTTVTLYIYTVKKTN